MFGQTPETISPQHLQHAEKAEKPQAGVELRPVLMSRNVLKFTEIGIQQLLPKRFGIGSPHLIDKRNDVVIHRAFSAALKIYEPRFTILHHHIPRLEIPIEKSRVHIVASKQVVAKPLEVVLQGILVKFQPRRLEEAILEIVQIVENTP